MNRALAELTQAQNTRFFSQSIQSLMQERAELVDTLLVSLWQRFELNDSELSLNAVGGYGRSRLHPCSDIDIAIITPTQLNDEIAQKISAFVTALWDLGVDIGHSVRTLDSTFEFAKTDLTIATNLLDIRTVCGDKTHAQQVLNWLYSDSISDVDFYQGKLEEQANRHAKAFNTALYLEPNLKSNPGGMRDFQTLVWVARKHLSVSDNALFSASELLQEDEQFELTESFDFICRVRWALHSVTGRAQEALQFEHQADVAAFLQFGSDENAQQAIERMMRHLFKAMTRVQELNQITCQHVERLISPHKNVKSEPLTPHFVLKNGLIEATSTSVFIDKAEVMRLFKLLASTPDANGISPDTLGLLRKVRRRLLGELQDYQACREIFIELFQTPNALSKVLGLMHRYGILEVYSMQWAATEGRMQFDIHNAYTVDEHVYKTVHFLTQFAKQSEQTSYQQAFHRVQDKLALFIAAFCHHLSGSLDSETQVISALHAKEFAQMHSLKSSSVELVGYLVEHQDLLLNTVRTQDIYDSQTIVLLCQKVNSLERLNALYALTVADIMATNSQAWNDWQEAMLTQLYLACREYFKTSATSVFEQRTIIRENKAQAESILLQKGIDKVALANFWQNLPSTFFTYSSVSELVDISDNLVSQKALPRVFLSQSDMLGCSTLVVYSNNREKLFIDIFNTLAKARVNIKDAELMETKDGKVLEVFKILDANDEPLQEQTRISRILKQVENVVLKGAQKTKLPVSRKVTHFDGEPHVEFLTTPKRNRSLLKVSTLNNPIYMEKICAVFRSRNLLLHSAKISSLGETLESVFLLSHQGGESLTQTVKGTVVDELTSRIA